MKPLHPTDSCHFSKLTPWQNLSFWFLSSPLDLAPAVKTITRTHPRIKAEVLRIFTWLAVPATAFIRKQPTVKMAVEPNLVIRIPVNRNKTWQHQPVNS